MRSEGSSLHVGEARLLLQPIAQVLSPGVWQVVGEPALVTLVVVTVVAAGVGLWLLGRGLADGSEPADRINCLRRSRSF